LLLDFAYACGSPLNESDQYTIKSPPGKETDWKHVLRLCSHCKPSEAASPENPNSVDKISQDFFRTALAILLAPRLAPRISHAPS
jgi:hypothetical protein